MAADAARLRAMVQRIAETSAPQGGLAQVVESAGVGRQEHAQELVLEGVQRALDDRDLTSAHATVLEQIVLPYYRPVIDVRNDSFERRPPAWESLDRHRAVIEAAIPSVGRIELTGHPSVSWAGTGFLIGNDLLLTARHVAELFTRGVSPRRLRFRPGRGSAIDFKREVEPSEPILMEVSAAALIHPYWDAALLRVTGIESQRRPLRLASSEPRQLDNRQIVVIGYPGFQQDSDPEHTAHQIRIFRGVFGCKRLQPGFVMGYRPISWYGQVVQALAHDSSTLGGNSGSAVIDLDTGQVLGLHFGGAYLVANYTVPAWELANDPHLVECGIAQVEGTTPAPPPSWLRHWAVEAEQEGSQAVPADRGAPAEDGDANSAPPEPAPHQPLPGDWYERVDDGTVAAALARNPGAALALLCGVLDADDAAAVARELAPDNGDGAATPRDPLTPDIVLVHGLLGAHLDTVAGPVGRTWLEPSQLISGELASRLMLAPDGVSDGSGRHDLRPVGQLRAWYSRAARQWRRAGFAAYQFSYDWRKSIVPAADQLHLFIEALSIERRGRPVVLVAHGQGGLVACVYASRHAQWSDRVLRAVLLGVPLGGCFVPLELVSGIHPLLSKLTWISGANDIDELCRAAATMPGLIQMLPNPTLFPQADALYTQSSWPNGLAPLQRWLDHSRNLKSTLLASPLLERAAHLIARGQGTVATLSLEDGRMLWPGPRTSPGDGAVPIRAAAVEGVPTFEIGGSHYTIPSDPQAVQATIDLIGTGSCNLAPLGPGGGDDRVVLPQPESPELREGAQTGIRHRLTVGSLLAQDLDWLLASAFSELPRP